MSKINIRILYSFIEDIPQHFYRNFENENVTCRKQLNIATIEMEHEKSSSGRILTSRIQEFYKDIINAVHFHTQKSPSETKFCLEFCFLSRILSEF